MAKYDANPTELVSVVFGLLHYAVCCLTELPVAQRPFSTEASSEGFVPFPFNKQPEIVKISNGRNSCAKF